LKLTVRNLGQIDQAEFDIRPLTVLIGEPGTNKSWVAYSLYGLLRPWVQADSPRSRSQPGTTVGFTLRSSSPDALARIRDDNARLALELARSVGVNISLERDFSRYFRAEALEVEFSSTPFFLNQLLRLGKGAQPADVRLLYNRLELNPNTDFFQLTLPASATWVELTSSNFKARQFIRETDALRTDAYWRDLLDTAFNLWSISPAGDVFALPAERNSLTHVHDLLRDEFTEAFSLPVSDYVEFLKMQRTLAANGFAPKTPPPFLDLAGLLESRITRGALGLASSLMRSLAGFILYLKTTAKPGDLLFVDEVEMDAHPGAQLVLTELLAILVHRGVRVVMTTHSPYVIEHLNNLMAAAQVQAGRQDTLLGHFQLHSREAFLSPEQVSAHEFTFKGVQSDKVGTREVVDRQTGTLRWTASQPFAETQSQLRARLEEAKQAG